jgi:predicted MPP superfamily phosphohydrolase
LRNRLVIFLTVFQALLILVHGFLFSTWDYFWYRSSTAGSDVGPLSHPRLLVALAILSVSFLLTSIIGFRSTNPVLRFFYRIAAVWLGFVNYAFFSAVLCWASYLAARMAGLQTDRRNLAIMFLTIAIVATLFAMVNAAWTRVRRITVKLPGLPPSWHGRTAVLASDIHLGNYRTYGFVRRIVRMIAALKPDIVFLAGDFYDGTPADLNRLANPLSQLSPPLGAFFVEGNHEEFTGSSKYLKAIAGAGVRILNNEREIIDGVQIVGITYWDASHGERFSQTLRATGLNAARLSILLTHAPDHVEVSAQEGISLQLSGHTHGGQFWPWTLAARRMYGKYVYGLQRMGALQVYTSYGAGTWGPPLRLGSSPEIVLIRFE